MRYWRGSFWLWRGGRYSELPSTEVRAEIVNHLNRWYRHVGCGTVSSVLEQVKAKSIVHIGHNPPCWLDGTAKDFADWSLNDIVICNNGMLHLPSLVERKSPFLVDSSPSLFTMSALDYPFDSAASGCERRLQFLCISSGPYPASIATLQEWIGYCLTPDTREQKMLLLIGPKRSGKETLARVLRAVVGEDNVCGPTLGGLATQFGLWPILNKSLAIVSDARSAAAQTKPLSSSGCYRSRVKTRRRSTGRISSL